jgi:outer membrane protein TolC
MDLKRVFPVTILFFALLTKFSFAQESIVPDLAGNYLSRLIDTAMAHYPKAKSYQNRIEIAKDVITTNKASLLNALTVSYVYQPGQTTINPVNPASSYFKGLQAGVFLNIGTLIAQPSQVRQAKEELMIAKQDQEEYVLNLATEVKKRYYVYIECMAQLKLQINALQDAQNSFNDIKYKFEKGEESFENFNKMQSDLTNHKSAKIQAEANLFLAKADVEELLGVKLEYIK